MLNRSNISDCQNMHNHYCQRVWFVFFFFFFGNHFHGCVISGTLPWLSGWISWWLWYWEHFHISRPFGCCLCKKKKKCWFDSFACWRNWFLQKLICLTSLFSRREIWMWFRYGNVLSWIWLFSLLAWEVMRRNSNCSGTRCINICSWFLCPVLKKSLFKTMKTFIYFTFRTFFKMYLLLEPLPFHFLSIKAHNLSLLSSRIYMVDRYPKPFLLQIDR